MRARSVGTQHRCCGRAPRAGYSANHEAEKSERKSNEMATPDYFLRQRHIPDWDQDLIEKQVALCLGVGGLGSSVAIACVRLGFERVILLDYDTVDFHNVNRQMCFNISKIGERKVDAAAETLKSHNIRSEIETHHFDALKHWDRVVELAQRSSVIFNMIDVGLYFDFAVQSLALKLHKPLISGGTYGHTITVDSISSFGKPCWACISDLDNLEVMKQLTLDRILDLKDISFIPRDNNPTGLSNVYIACTASHFMVSIFVQNLMKQPDVPNRLIFYMNTFEIVKWSVERNPNCVLCGTTE
jgi:molybdopterin/thiamine biosynthesis adenylyltransferase